MEPLSVFLGTPSYRDKSKCLLWKKSIIYKGFMKSLHLQFIRRSLNNGFLIGASHFYLCVVQAICSIVPSDIPTMKQLVYPFVLTIPQCMSNNKDKKIRVQISLYSWPYCKLLSVCKESSMSEQGVWTGSETCVMTGSGVQIDTETTKQNYSSFCPSGSVATSQMFWVTDISSQYRMWWGFAVMDWSRGEERCW